MKIQANGISIEVEDASARGTNGRGGVAEPPSGRPAVLLLMGRAMRPVAA